MKENKRLFVGNLPPNATEDDLRNEFSAYGRVVAVDIKTKEGNTNSDKSNKFGFVNIDLDDYMTRQCIQEFKETAYKGFYLTVSVAKESFLDKLKRERDEAARQESRKQEEFSRPKLKEVESEEFVIKPSKYKAEPVHQHLGEDDGEGAFKRRSKGAYLEDGNVKILGGTGTRLHADTNEEFQPLSGQSNVSNQKRLESLNKLKQAHDKQKFAIRNALKNSDAPRGNKIVFDNDESTRPGRAQLFEDDEEGDYSKDFVSKKQFEGEHGQKLLALKTKFKNDDRFQMGEDFFEGEAGADTSMTEQQGERQRQLEILGSVVGKTFDTRKKKTNLQPTMLRFDPTKATHQKFYKTTDGSAAAAYEEPMDTAEDMPKVSSDQFYKVSNTIGQTMQGESQGFSLLKMMGHSAEGGDQSGAPGSGYYAEPIEQRQKKQNYNENPFKYDSSDDESGAKKTRPAPGTQPQQPQTKKVGGKTNKRGIFRENFFILPGDARLEQGLAFFTAGPRDKTRNFQEIKKNLKKVVNKKVKKNKSMQKSSFGGRKVFKQKK